MNSQGDRVTVRQADVPVRRRRTDLSGGGLFDGGGRWHVRQCRDREREVPHHKGTERMISENSYCDEGPVTSGKFLTSAAADASLSYGSWFSFPLPVSYRRISLPARPAWPCRRCPRARPWSRWCRRRRGRCGTHSLMHGMEAGLGALFAGDRDLPLVTAHVVDELGHSERKS